MADRRFTARAYAVAASTAIRERLAYPGNHAASMLTYGLFIFIFSRVWAGAYARDTTIAGYTHSMAIWYFIVAEMTAFGMGRFFWTLSRDMKSGQVAYLLARPYDFVWYHYAERVGGALVDLCLIMAEGFLLGLVLAGPFPPLAAGSGAVAEAARLALTVASLLLAGSINFMLQFAVAMTAFWLEENDALFWIYQKLALIVGTLVPIEFLPAAAAKAAIWTPFPYLSYAPARIFVAFSWAGAGSLMARQLAWLALAILLAKAVFALGSRSVAVNGG